MNGLKQQDIGRIILGINNRPLKCLSYQTPAEQFDQNLRKINGQN